MSDSPYLRLVTQKDRAYPLQPGHINTNKPLWGAFGNSETEVSALWVVRFCQTKGGWIPFTYEEINRFYRKNQRQATFTFNQLIDKGYLVKQDEVYYITHEFISRCFKASPASWNWEADETTERI